MTCWRNRTVAAALLAATAALAAPTVSGAAPPREAASAGADRSPRVVFYFGLKRPEARARAAFAAVSRPGSGSYRSFAPVAVVSGRYGARPAVRRAFRRAARRHGLRATVDRSGVFARVSGSVRTFERVLGRRVRASFNNDVNATAWYVSGRAPLRLPRALRRVTREVVAIYSRSTGPPPAGRARAAQGPQPANAGTWTGGCADAQATGAYSFAQVRSAYGIDAIGAGNGAAVAIVNVGEGIAAQDVAENARCFGYPAARTRTLLADGQRRPFRRGSFEPQEDLALVRGMAPALHSLTFAQTWLTPSLWFLAPAEVLAAGALPDTLSISYGACERDVRGRAAGATSRAGAELMDSMLVRLGLAGVASFASAGDFGSTCNGRPFPGVAWPASSPYLTAVGGTRLVLDAANRRVDEVVWNDLPWLATDDGGGAGGGGWAGWSRRPGYQDALGLPGDRRAVPDMAAHASMLPGWPVVLAGNWVQDAGTSASAPLLAGAFAALSARERAAGRPPLGPVNGLVYALAANDPATRFDVVSGDNGYLRRVPAISAAPGYDRASGLGVPELSALADALPPPAPR